MYKYMDILKTDNCYIDLSTYNPITQIITTQKTSFQNPAEKNLTSSLVIVADDGYKLSESIGYFTLNLTDDVNSTNLINISFDDFQVPDSPIDFKDVFNQYDTSYFQFRDKDYSKSRLIEYGDFIIILVGGFDDFKIIVSVFKKTTLNSNYIEYNGFKYKQVHLANRVSDGMGGYTSIWDRVVTISLSTYSNDSIENLVDDIFTTYYMDNSVIKKIRSEGALNPEIIINTISYPLKFNDDDLVDTTIKSGYISGNIVSKTFNKNITRLNIFEFIVPDVNDVTNVIIRVPFYNDISISYEDIRGCTVTGYIEYEVLSNTTTLYISNGEYNIFKTVYNVGVKVPYKPTGELSNFSSSDSRMSVENPIMMIKGKQEVQKSNYLKGFIKDSIDNMLKEEVQILNTILQKGIVMND